MELDSIIAPIIAGTSLAIAAVLGAAVLSRLVHDGIVIKIGLCSMALGFVVVAMHVVKLAAVDLIGLERALLLINGGVSVVLVGYLRKTHHAGHSLRRVSDWAEADTLPLED